MDISWGILDAEQVVDYGRMPPLSFASKKSISFFEKNESEDICFIL